MLNIFYGRKAGSVEFPVKLIIGAFRALERHLGSESLALAFFLLCIIIVISIGLFIYWIRHKS